ncbi:nuclear transport factor 2 family protein [Flavobacterium aestuarii]|uniref:nuclear transport factor 2 family protein n=1 Tax=Flavobacterium aestuarii TaxID=3149227 RepID=UPI0032B37D33
MKTIFLSLAVFALVSFDSQHYKETDQKEQINRTLDAWHKAAAEADFKAYFGMMDNDAIYIGTDPSENWDMEGFKAFAKPYFDKGKAWEFKVMERHVYMDNSGKLAWFDELLNTQMKICRGSGIVVKIGKEWKIKHYVLSMTIPNDNIDEVVKIIAPIEDLLLQKGSSK